MPVDVGGRSARAATPRSREGRGLACRTSASCRIGWRAGTSWNSRNPDRIMAHYAEDAVFQSPSVLALGGSSDGIVRGKREITEFTRRAFERFPKLRFEVEDMIERPHRVIVIYRKLGVFADDPGFTVEVFEFENDLVKRNVVYWSAEEVASRFRALSS